MTYNKDVLVIGAGAVGTAIARELSKFRLEVMVVDKNDDVGGDASKSCSSCCSTESTVAPFTLESKIAQSSRPLFYHLCEDLDIPIHYCGSITPALNEYQLSQIPAMLEKAFNNGVYDAEYLTHDELMEKQACPAAARKRAAESMNRFVHLDLRKMIRLFHRRF